MRRSFIFSFIFLAIGFLFIHFSASYSYATASEHKHCLCGGKIGATQYHSHSEIEWKPLPDDFTGGRLEGSYYLTDDITLDSYIVGKYNLCLNGYTINAGTYKLSPDYQSTLNICDCSANNKGEIKASKGNSGLIRYMGTNTNIYGGTITAYSNIMYNNNADIYTDYTSNLKIFGGKFNSEIGNCIFADLHNKGINEIVIYDGEFVSHTTSSAAIVLNKGYVSIYNGKIGSDYYGIMTKKSANVNFHGGKITSKDYGIYNSDEKGDITIDGGEIVSDSEAIRNRSGNLNVRGGVLSSRKSDCVLNESGVVTITDGRLISEQKGRKGINNTEGRIFITGGSIQSNGYGICNSGYCFIGNSPLIKSGADYSTIYLSKNNIITVGDSEDNKLRANIPYTIETAEKPTANSQVTVTNRLNTDFSSIFKSFDNKYIIVQKDGIVQLKLADIYCVKYKPGKDGVGEEQEQKKYEGSDIKLKESIFSRNGFMQTGWSTRENGPKEYSFDEQYKIDNDLVLYPSWERNRLCTVKFIIQTKAGDHYQNSCTGGYVDLDEATGYEGESIRNIAAANDRYHFAGWFSDDNIKLSDESVYNINFTSGMHELVVYVRFDPDVEVIPTESNNRNSWDNQSKEEASINSPDTGDVRNPIACFIGILFIFCCGIIGCVYCCRDQL